MGWLVLFFWLCVCVCSFFWCVFVWGVGGWGGDFEREQPCPQTPTHFCHQFSAPLSLVGFLERALATSPWRKEKHAQRKSKKNTKHAPTNHVSPKHAFVVVFFGLRGRRWARPFPSDRFGLGRWELWCNPLCGFLLFSCQKPIGSRLSLEGRTGH